MQNVLVLGASGTVGSLLVPALVAAGQRVRAASRHAKAFAGAEAVRFDFADPGTHGPAFDGVDRLYLLMPADNLQVQEYLLPVIATAAARGVKTVLQSVMGVEHEPQNPYRQVELALQRALPSAVVLRPNWFADNFHGLWAPAVAQGVIALPAGTGASSFVDARDIAACALAALTSTRFDGQAFTLTGPQALDYDAAAALLSQAAGRRIVYQAIDDERFVAGLQDAGVPADHGRMLAGLFAAVRAGATAQVSDAVERMTGRPARSLAQYVADHADAFQ
ncbi:NmrA family NAD(P)-binding protein [Pseudorhodoferax sp.]|uniref:NmrA family NAD(P)-binding protein n=1 Tax=Pseudorhodoferax sp. TaxID=1993553 RepID=UPI002DD6317B|nr:NAD(P)H-binding protein [Pseudorhodoferax sp.]